MRKKVFALLSLLMAASMVRITTAAKYIAPGPARTVAMDPNLIKETMMVTT